MKKLFIRADANQSIGLGHIMRCIAIGQSWKKQGGTVCFLTKPLHEKIIERLTLEGFQHIELANFNEIAQIKEIMQSHTDGLLLLDGYQFTASYQQAIKDAEVLLIVIDDFSHASHYYADIVINRNLIASTELYKGKIEIYTKLLLGPTYNFVRQEFLTYSEECFEVKPRIETIFVNFGGSDSKNLTIHIAKFLAQQPENYRIMVVVGATYQHLKELYDLATGKNRISIFYDAKNIADIMYEADLAITAGGTTLFELSCLGIPNISLKVADNQKSIDVFAEKGMTCALDARAKLSEELLIENLNLLQSRKNRQEMSSKSQKFIDSLGNQRIVKALAKL